MSIGIYSFLRIYFFGFGLSAFAQFRTHCASSPAFGRRSALALVRSGFWHGLPCCLSCAVVSGALEWAGVTGGAYSRRPAPPGQSLNRRKNKKRPTSPSQIKTHLIVQVSKNSEKNKKTPYGAIECVILAKERWNQKCKCSVESCCLLDLF